MPPEGTSASSVATAPAGIREDIDVTFFVPCLNEASRVGPTLDSISDAMASSRLSYEVIVVDDGSKDRTSEVVEEYRAAHPEMPVTLRVNRGNLGLAHSFVDAAFEGRGRYYRLICGDNIEPSESISAVIAEAGRADIVIPYYPAVPGKSRLRLALSGLFTRIVNIASGHNLKYYNGNPLYKRYHVMRWAPHNYGFGYQADLLTQLLDQGATFIQLPIAGLHRAKEKGSSVKLRNLLSVAHSLLEIFLRSIRAVLFKRSTNNQHSNNGKGEA
jgi:glycosyltransferase involved in cell wall biosynthesis